MSAFVCSFNHINAIVNFAADHIEYGKKIKNKKILTDIGQTLWDENYKSVNSLYSEETVKEYWEDNNTYKFVKSENPLNAVQIIKLVISLRYQSNEHSEWKESDAKKLCERITSAAIELLEGYEEAKWAIG